MEIQIKDKSQTAVGTTAWVIRVDYLTVSFATKNDDTNVEFFIALGKELEMSKAAYDAELDE